VKHTVGHRKAISIALAGRILSLEHRNNLSKNKTKWWENHPEMRGFSSEHSNAISLAKIEYYQEHPMSSDIKILISQRTKEGMDNLETRKKLSLSASGRVMTPESNLKRSIALSGEKGPAWKGGISRLPYAFEFNGKLKEKIRQRDNYTCQLCGITECDCIEKLSIHHIDYDKKNSSESNLVSLCRSCNGKVNTNRDTWTNYFLENVITANKELQCQQ